LRRLAIWIASLALAGLLIYLTLRRTNLVEIGEAFRQANYWWCVPMVLITLFSHVVRAWRWQAMLEVLPEAQRRPSLLTAFGSVMIGFMVNYLLPRVGEFVRAGNLARREKLPYSGVLGTIVTERAIDLGTFAIGAALSAFALTGAQRAGLRENMLRPAIERVVSIPSLGLLAAALLGAAVVWWILTRTPLKRTLSRFIAPLWSSFLGGVGAAYHSPRKWMLVLSTVGIWLLYGLMAYLPLVMFDIAGPYDLGPVDAMVIMFIGVLGVIVPSPGGAVSFHYVTVLALTLFYGVSASAAATYAVFVHGAQLMLYLATGLLVITLEDTKLAQLRAYARNTGTNSAPTDR